MPGFIFPPSKIRAIKFVRAVKVWHLDRSQLGLQRAVGHGTASPLGAREGDHLSLNLLQLQQVTAEERHTSGFVCRLFY